MGPLSPSPTPDVFCDKKVALGLSLSQAAAGLHVPGCKVCKPGRCWGAESDGPTWVLHFMTFLIFELC